MINSHNRKYLIQTVEKFFKNFHISNQICFVKEINILLIYN